MIAGRVERGGQAGEDAAAVMRDGQTLPCIGAGARITRPPKCWPIAWWPRQIPSKGSRASAQAATSASEMPASSGVPGPGEIRIAVGPARQRLGGGSARRCARP